MRLRPVLAAVEAVGGDFCVDLRRGIVVQQGIADCSVHVCLGLILRDVGRVDGAGDHGVDFRLSVGLGLVVGIALDLQRVRVVLQAGQQRAREVQVPQHVGALQQLPGGRVRPPRRCIRQGHGHQSSCDGCVRLSAAVVAAEVNGAHSCSDGGVHLRGGAVIDQRSRDQRVDFGSVAEGCQSGCNCCVSLRCRLVGRQRRGNGGCNRSVRLGRAVGIAGDTQGQVLVLQADAQRSRDVQPPQSAGTHQQLEGGLPRPFWRILHGPGGQHGQLRQHGVDRALQAGLQGIQIGGASEGPGALQGQDVGLCAGSPRPAVLQRKPRRRPSAHLGGPARRPGPPA